MKTHTRFQLRLAAAFLAASTITTLGLAQANPRDSRPAKMPDTRPVERVSLEAEPVKLDRMDKNFVEDATKRFMEDVRISRVALQRTTNPQVKRLADMIVAESEMLDSDLTRIAMQRGVTLPAKEIRDDEWVKKDAGKFDQDYLDKMVNDLEDAVKSFDNEARRGDDTDSVNLARKHLATLQKHLFAGLDLKRVYK